MNHYLVLKLRNASIDCDQHGQGNLAALLSEAIQEIEKLSGGDKLTRVSYGKAQQFETEKEMVDSLTGRAAQSEPATRAVPVATVFDQISPATQEINRRILELAAPTPDAERHVANHAGDLAGEQGRRITHLEAVAAEYNDLIVHMNAGGDFHEFMVVINAAPAQPTDKE